MMLQSVEVFPVNYPVADVLAKLNYAVVESNCFNIPEILVQSFRELKEFYSKIDDYQFGGKDFLLNRKMEQGEFVLLGSKLSAFKGRFKKESTSAYQFVNAEIYNNLFLQCVIKTCLSLLPDQYQDESEKQPRYINVVLTRHDKSVDSLGAHRDYLFDWIIQFNIERSSQGISGGDIQIFDKTHQLVVQKLLRSPLDCYFIKDSEFYHGATPIQVSQEGAVRDVLIIRPRKQTTKIQ